MTELPKLKPTEWSGYDEGWNDAIRACEDVLEAMRAEIEIRRDDQMKLGREVGVLRVKVGS